MLFNRLPGIFPRIAFPCCKLSKLHLYISAKGQTEKIQYKQFFYKQFFLADNGRKALFQDVFPFPKKRELLYLIE
jgi:hypothetical protein